MKKILLIDGIYPINTRNKRIVDSLKKKYEVKFCAWNRGNREIIKDENYVFSSQEGYGNKIKKLLGMKNYLLFIKKELKEYKPELVIASQWDMLFLIFLSGYRGKIIYENLDLPTSNNKIILKSLLFLEKLTLKKVNGIIYASRFFKPLYKKFNLKKELILENLPLRNIDFKVEENLVRKYKFKIRLSFIGTLRYFETMKKLMDVIQKKENMELYLIGKGPEREKFKMYVKKNNIKNVFFIEGYDYINIKKYYIESDVIWAAYPNKDYNVKYAISNKFFECMLFEKPCFFSNNTFLGEFVEKNNIGISVNPYNSKEIENKIINLNNQKIERIKNNIKKYNQRNNIFYWEDKEKKLIEFISDIVEEKK